MVSGKSYRKKSKTAKSLKVKKSPLSNVQKLQKQVNTLSRQLVKKSTKHHLYQAITNIDPIVNPFNYYNLTQWNNVSSIFGTALTDWSNSNRMIFKKLMVDVKIEQSLESDPTTITLFLVSLKDNANTTSRFNASTGALALNSATDYAMLNGSMILNPRVFNIHKVKKIYFTNGGANLSSTGAGDHKLVYRWYRFNMSPGHVVENATSNVRDMVCSQDPSKCYYLIAATDNLLADLTAPAISIQCHYKVEFPE